MITRRTFFAGAAGLAMAATAVTGAAAFPTDTISIVVPYSPGATDTLARTLVPELEKILGQTILVETRPGAGGTVGANFVANSAEADGHTLLFAVSSVQTVAPHQRELPYAFEDLKPVARITAGPNMMAARTDAPFGTLEELVAYAKANPGAVTFGSAGTGGATHLAGEAFARAAGVELNHIPFEGVTPAVAATVGGTIDLVLGFASALMPQVAGGNLVAIAQFGDERASVVPDVTTLKEGGVDLSMPPNIGVWVPAETPDDVVATLEAAFEQAAASEAFQQHARNSLTEVDFIGSEAFAQELEREDAFFADLLAALGMTK
ncbi:tripartite tricarboxylate transporter substrate binding protein [Salinarimonas rosea]|uniref:tripartite tricarboxylate transporter substrate binding protein n=1 Tax=Salinarimonas rosea TaxID=552063 RepID=UPI000411E5CE|nr:tripartite tricarboxylate transporter substrate binding protein [Salinarimonas rosea]